MEEAALSPYENMLGDVNIHIDSHKLSAKYFISVLLDFDFIQYVSQPHAYMDIRLM